MEKQGFFVFSHYAPEGGCVCWHCGKRGERFARYRVGYYYVGRGPDVAELAEMCPDCEPRALRGERGNG